MRKFCESLREHAMKVIKFKKKKNKLLTKEQQKSCQNSTMCYTRFFLKENFFVRKLASKNMKP